MNKPGSQPAARRKVVFVFGVPGAGKSTLFRTLIMRLGGFEAFSKSTFGLVKYMQYKEEDSEKRLLIIGEYSEKATSYAEGTDKLSMGVQPSFEKFLRRNQDHIILEGDRLCTIKTIELASKIGYDVLGVELMHPGDDELAERYKNRGSNQSETFRKGRHTKVNNIVDWMSEHAHNHMQIIPRNSRAISDCLSNVEFVLRFLGYDSLKGDSTVQVKFSSKEIIIGSAEEPAALPSGESAQRF